MKKKKFLLVITLLINLAFISFSIVMWFKDNEEQKELNLITYNQADINNVLNSKDNNHLHIHKRYDALYFSQDYIVDDNDDLLDLLKSLKYEEITKPNAYNSKYKLKGDSFKADVYLYDDMPIINVDISIKKDYRKSKASRYYKIEKEDYVKIKEVIEKKFVNFNVTIV